MSRKETTIVLDGVEVGLRLDFYAIGMLEDATGEPFLSAAKIEEEAKGFDTREMTLWLHALAAAWSRYHGQPPRARDEIAGMIGIGDIVTVQDAVVDLTRRNLPDVDQTEVVASVDRERPTLATAAP